MESENISYNFGRVYKEDIRDNEHLLLSSSFDTMPQIDEKFWWSGGWYGNQKTTPHCVAYSWSHWFEDGPVIQNAMPERIKPVFDLKEFYDECRKRDGIDGNYEGTTVRAAAKILRELNVIYEYRWAKSIDDVIAAVTYIGPVVAGTNWFQEMSKPTSAQHIMRVRGRSQGGHAYLINGVDNDKEVFRIKNSWGRSWGDNGQAYIKFRDFEKLLDDRGEACVAFSNKVTEVPLLSNLKPADD